MQVGIPKEILAEEKRVAATPESVRKHVDMGFNVAVEAIEQGTLNHHFEEN